MDGEEEELKDGATVSGAKTAKLSVVVPTDACSHEYAYTCRVSNGEGTVTSRTAHLRGQHLYYWVHGGTPTSVTEGKSRPSVSSSHSKGTEPPGISIIALRFRRIFSTSHSRLSIIDYLGGLVNTNFL